MVSENQYITTINEVELYIKREDLLHPFISGNKLRKLKYNLIEAKNQRKTTIITFGGAFSNHIAATAYAAYTNDFESIGIIRGDELENNFQDNPTLAFAKKNKMQFIFVTREAFRDKETLINEIISTNNLENYYILPEGGTNDLAIKGCKEILSSEDEKFNFITSCIGTAGTITGIIERAKSNQKILGFPALKVDFHNELIRNYTVKDNWELILDYHFEGYGKVNEILIDFLNQFYLDYKIPLDPIYTGKMVYGVIDLIHKNYFPKQSKILMIHTGGLQGINGMNLLLKKKNKKLIEY
jgi:1-aminocyclopropane-1-carboxylate deaminase